MSNPSTEPSRKFAVEVVKRLQRAGFQALWAGGCVRDLLLGLTPTDYDVATDARPEQVMGLFRRTVPVGLSFGVVRVRGPRGSGEVEVATFRSDGEYQDGRHPESVHFSTPEADASRRDFTINGMFLDPLTDSVIDYVGGRKDLQSQTLRAIGNPSERFEEDKLRLLRAVRFAARFDMEIEPATWEALAAMASQIRVVAAERIAQELQKMLVHSNRVRALNLAREVGLLDEILPPVAALPGFPAEGGDLWDQTIRVLGHLPTQPSFPLAFAALLHAVGKPVLAAVANQEGGESDEQAVVRRIAENLCRGLKLSNADRERIGWLVASQDALKEARALPMARLKRWLAEPGIEELLALQRAKALALSEDLGEVEFCEWFRKTKPQGPINPPPLVTGHDLQKQLGLKPGPHFKGLLEQVRDAQLEQTIHSKDEALDWLRQRLESDGQDEQS